VVIKIISEIKKNST